MEQEHKKRSSLNETKTNAFSAEMEADGNAEEEFAAELAEGAGGAALTEDGNARAANRSQPARQERGEQAMMRDQDEAPGAGWGMTALALAIAAWFVWPAVLAPASVIIGIAAFVRGRRSLGAWSIALGLIAFVLYLMSTPIL